MRKTFRPRLESLEDRLVPAVNNWLGTVDGNWNTAGNWSLGNVPTVQDDVVFRSQNNVGCSFAAYSAQPVTLAKSITIESGYESLITVSMFNIFATPGGMVSVGNLVQDGDAAFELGPNTSLTVQNWELNDGGFNTLSSFGNEVVTVTESFSWTIETTIGAGVVLNSNAAGNINFTRGGVLWKFGAGLTNYGTIHHHSAEFYVTAGDATNYAGYVNNKGAYYVTSVSNQLDIVDLQIAFENTHADALLRVTDCMLRLSNPGARAASLTQTAGTIELESAAGIQGNEGDTKREFKIQGGVVQTLDGSECFMTNCDVVFSGTAQLKLAVNDPVNAGVFTVDMELIFKDSSKFFARVKHNGTAWVTDAVEAKRMSFVGNNVQAEITSVGEPPEFMIFSPLSVWGTGETIQGGFGGVTLGDAFFDREVVPYGNSWEVWT